MLVPLFLLLLVTASLEAPRLAVSHRRRCCTLHTLHTPLSQAALL
jgi:hypothetical protein